MPLSISVIKKYFPALSQVLSLLSSHLLALGKRKFDGGGPAGVAGRAAVVEKKATGVAEGNCEVRNRAEAGLVRARAVIVLVLLAIMSELRLAEKRKRVVAMGGDAGSQVDGSHGLTKTSGVIGRNDARREDHNEAVLSWIEIEY